MTKKTESRILTKQMESCCRGEHTHTHGNDEAAGDGDTRKPKIAVCLTRVKQGRLMHKCIHFCGLPRGESVEKRVLITVCLLCCHWQLWSDTFPAGDLGMKGVFFFLFVSEFDGQY